MGLLEQVSADIKSAMLAQDKVRTAALRNIRAAFIEALKADAPMPIDIYDAVTWSAITPLSEQSIASGYQTLAFPDFTDGQWRARKPIFAFDDRY